MCYLNRNIFHNNPYLTLKRGQFIQISDMIENSQKL